MGKKGKGEEEVVVPARLWGGKGKKGGEKKMEWHWQKSLGKKEDLFRSFSSTEKAKKSKTLRFCFATSHLERQVRGRKRCKH